MSSHKHKEHLERIKEAIHSSNKLSDSEKSSSVKIVEEWFREDKAMGTLKEELLKISLFFKDIFVELGLD